MAALAALAVLSVFAGPISTYLVETSEQLFDGTDYVTAVLGQGEES